ncbi:MAG TPA: hypothetical protein VF787_06500, partial [Thermoanaerobaculia bacterium]
ESGWMAAYAAGSAWPGVSTTSYRVAKTRANNTLISLSDGAFEVKNGGGSAVHFIVDVTGYFQ